MRKRLVKKAEVTNADIDASENAIANREVEGLTQRQIVIRRFLNHKGAVTSMIVLASIIIVVFLGTGLHLGPLKIPGWWKYTIDDLSELRVCSDGRLGCPSLSVVPTFLGGDGIHLGAHPLGQDDIGHDYLALVLRGAQRSLMVTFIIGSVAGFIGTVVGAIAGFFSGRIDNVLMRFVDFLITIPSIIIGSVIGYHFGNLGAVFLAFYLGLFAWTGLSRLVRGEFLSLREREFVDAARVAGASNRRIIFKHILPNAVGVIIVSVTLLMSGAILLETALSYLGFGVTPPDVSLGLLISTYQDSFTTRPYLFWWPGIMIIAIALSINFIGDGLRDAFDPRQRRKVSLRERRKNRKEEKLGASAHE